MLDAMDRFRLLQNQSLLKAVAAKAPAAVQFGQKTTPIHPQNGLNSDVFIKSVKGPGKPEPVQAAQKQDAGLKLQSALKNMLSQVGQLNKAQQLNKIDPKNNVLFQALSRIAPATQTARPEASRKAAETPIALSKQNPSPTTHSPESPFLKVGDQKQSALQALTKSDTKGVQNPSTAAKFAGAGVTGAALSALTATVATPATLVANPGLLAKLLAKLPTQIP